jgi:hypothetical protein
MKSHIEPRMTAARHEPVGGHMREAVREATTATAAEAPRTAHELIRKSATADRRRCQP